MTELNKTIAFVAVALLLTAAALWGSPSSRVVPSGEFREQGEPFFPKFADPLAARSLEVVDFDAETATARPFKVAFDPMKGWIIPSHNDYPADAKDRLARTASGVMDLRKDAFRSDRAEDHEALGVIDPLDEKATALKGRGKRVTLRDEHGEVLADFIIGNEVPGHPDQRFVRVPGQKRTYAVNVKVDLSTKFADWIETNLLKLDASRARRLVFNNHKVIPEQRRLQKGETLVVARKDGSGPWTMEGLEPGKELDTQKLSDLTRALSDLKIVGVRPKPEGLTRDLKAASGDQLKLSSDQALLSLVTKGFYLTEDGLYSNQGDVRVGTDQGVVYTLRFGEVTFASGEELTAGSGEDKAKSAEGEEKKDESSAAGRYLFVTVAFDPELVPKPEKDPNLLPDLPQNVFQLAADDPKRVEEEKQAQEKAESEQKAQEAKLDEGRKLVKELTDRFADWYYVVPAESARNIVLDRAALTRTPGEAPATPPAGSPPPFPPGFPGAGPTP